MMAVRNCRVAGLLVLCLGVDDRNSELRSMSELVAEPLLAGRVGTTDRTLFFFHDKVSGRCRGGDGKR